MEALRRASARQLRQSVGLVDGAAGHSSLRWLGFDRVWSTSWADMCWGVRHASSGKHVPPLALVDYDMKQFEPQQIRNFSIIGDACTMHCTACELVAGGSVQ
jgi:hypothetical protein